MNITVTKITGKSLVDLACSYTAGQPVDVKSMHRMYKAEHSPIRTQLFLIEMHDIPTFVSVHLVRHKIGVEHYVRSNREDRGGNSQADRLTPVDHMMFINAQSLINMSRKRLCSQASIETQRVMTEIKHLIRKQDPALADAMVADCEYRNGCYEFRSCGRYIKGE